MSIIEALRAYIITCPHIGADQPVLIDYLGTEVTGTTLEPLPCDPVFRQYTDGGCLRQFQFLFASREIYTADVQQCAANQAFYERFAAWIRAQNDAGSLPDLGEGRTTFALEILSNGYVLSEDTETARYQIQLRLIYEEE